MKKSDVLGIGHTYIVKVSGHLVPVKLTAISPYGGWVGKNLNTGREIRIRTAAKLRRVMITDGKFVLVHPEWGFMSTLPSEGTAGDWSLEPLHAYQFKSIDFANIARATHWFGNEQIKVRRYETCLKSMDERLAGLPKADAATMALLDKAIKS